MSEIELTSKAAFQDFYRKGKDSIFAFCAGQQAHELQQQQSEQQQAQNQQLQQHLQAQQQSQQAEQAQAPPPVQPGILPKLEDEEKKAANL